MTRRPLAFTCAGSDCAGTLDEAAGSTGLLIVSGGNEIRAGAWNGQALLATMLAAKGYPVFRFDRRGVGDSAGTNGGFRSSADDIRAALDTFRKAAPQLLRVVGFGNCDAASALMLARGAGCDALVLGNPWSVEQDEPESPAPEAIRAHYARRLRDPAALARLIAGRVSLRGLTASLRAMLQPVPPPSLVAELREGLDAFPGDVRILLAGRDRAADIFRARWDRTDPRIRTCASASHSFVEPEARLWLHDQVLSMLVATGA